MHNEEDYKKVRGIQQTVAAIRVQGSPTAARSPPSMVASPHPCLHAPTRHVQYAVIASKAVADFGGTFLVRGGEFTVRLCEPTPPPPPPPRPPLTATASAARSRSISI